MLWLGVVVLDSHCECHIFQYDRVVAISCELSTLEEILGLS